MKKKLEKIHSTQKIPLYTKKILGLSILFGGIYYFIQDRFHEGTFFLVVGIILVLMNIFSFLKKRSYDLFLAMGSIYMLVIGAVELFSLDKNLSIWVSIVFAIVSIFSVFKPIRKG